MFYKYLYLNFYQESQEFMSRESKNTLASLDQGLIGRFRSDCKTEWQQFINHRFVHELACGSLDPKEFKVFLVQDYFYLLEYCRVEALAIYKSDNFEDMNYFVTLIHGLLKVELPLHVSYCKKWGIELNAMDASSKSLPLIAYGQYLLNKAMQGDLLDLIVLLMPCLVGYGEIGFRLAENNSAKQENPYQSWIDLYASDEYSRFVKDGLNYLEKLAQKYGAEARYPLLLSQFRMVVKLEISFWDVGRSVLL